MFIIKKYKGFEAQRSNDITKRENPLLVQCTIIFGMQLIKKNNRSDYVNFVNDNSLSSEIQT